MPPDRRRRQRTRPASTEPGPARARVRRAVHRGRAGARARRGGPGRGRGLLPRRARHARLRRLGSSIVVALAPRAFPRRDEATPDAAIIGFSTSRPWRNGRRPGGLPGAPPHRPAGAGARHRDRQAAHRAPAPVTRGRGRSGLPSQCRCGTRTRSRSTATSGGIKSVAQLPSCLSVVEFADSVVQFCPSVVEFIKSVAQLSSVVEFVDSVVQFCQSVVEFIKSVAQLSVCCRVRRFCYPVLSIRRTVHQISNKLRRTIPPINCDYRKF